MKHDNATSGVPFTHLSISPELLKILGVITPVATDDPIYSSGPIVTLGTLGTASRGELRKARTVLEGEVREARTASEGEVEEAKSASEGNFK